MSNTNILGRSRHVATIGTTVGFSLHRAHRRDEDLHRKDLEFEVGDHVFLKVVPMGGGGGDEVWK